MIIKNLAKNLKIVYAPESPCNRVLILRRYCQVSRRSVEVQEDIKRLLPPLLTVTILPIMKRYAEI